MILMTCIKYIKMPTYLIKILKIGQDVVGIYKRSYNILNGEIIKSNLKLSNSNDTGLFKNDFEKNLYKNTKKKKILELIKR